MVPVRAAKPRPSVAAPAPMRKPAGPAHRYVAAAIEVLAALAPTLTEAMKTASTRAFVILDGTLLPIDRIAAGLTTSLARLDPPLVQREQVLLRARPGAIPSRRATHWRAAQDFAPAMAAAGLRSDQAGG